MKVGSLEIDIVRKNIKHLYIKVYPPNGTVRVVCPHRLEETIIKQFIAQKMSWIEQKRTKLQKLPHKQAQSKEYLTGEIHYYKGDRYVLNVIASSTKPKVVREQNRLDLYVGYNSIREQRAKILTDWYRQQLKAELPKEIDRWQRIIGVRVNDWGVKKMKTRWGTCNTSAKRIWLNLELIKPPHHCLEYVIVHELVHLLERQHNQRFWSYVGQYLPEWQQSQTELNQFPLG